MHNAPAYIQVYGLLDAEDEEDDDVDIADCVEEASETLTLVSCI